MQTASSPPLAVIDASVAARWFLLDENLVPESQRVVDDLRADRIALIVPGHFQIEVGNAIRNALRSHRLTLDAARTAMATLTALPTQAVHLDSLIAAGFDVALHYDCALYDALYLALADQAACPFVHADRRLHNTLAGRFPREMWIEDYAAR
jgi:predicted nucleic acid-binding protein